MCIGVCIGMRVGMFIGMRAGICMGMCIDMCIDIHDACQECLPSVLVAWSSNRGTNQVMTMLHNSKIQSNLGKTGHAISMERSTKRKPL